jgi:hypothetical protein
LNREAINRFLERIRVPEETDLGPGPAFEPEVWETFEEFVFPDDEELRTIDFNTEEGRRRLLDPAMFETLDQFEYYLRSRMSIDEIFRKRLEAIHETQEEPLPPYEEQEPPPPHEEPPPEYAATVQARTRTIRLALALLRIASHPRGARKIRSLQLMADSYPGP